MPKDTFAIGFVGRLKHGDLLEALERRGWNQTDGARFLGISPTEFSRMINMKSVPKLERVSKRLEKKLMELTGKSLEDLWPEQVFTEEFVDAPKILRAVREFPIPTLLSAFQQRQLSDPAHILGQKELTEDIKRVLQTLSPREEKVIRLRFFEGQTLKQVGKEMGVCAERARGIEAKALRRLRRPVRLRVLTGHLVE